MGKAGPLGIIQHLVYLPLMTISMVFSGFSRMLAAGMAVLPPSRVHGDEDAVRRLVRRPTNAIEALAGVPKEFMWGLANATEGFLYDPIAVRSIISLYYSVALNI